MPVPLTRTFLVFVSALALSSAVVQRAEAVDVLRATQLLVVWRVL